MSDILHAFAISGGILLLVVILIIIVSIITVNRGAAEMAGGVHEHTAEAVAPKESSPAAAKPAAKPGAVPAGDEINVLQILGMGTALFVLAILGLFALSLIEHM